MAICFNKIIAILKKDLKNMRFCYKIKQIKNLKYSEEY